MQKIRLHPDPIDREPDRVQAVRDALARCLAELDALDLHQAAIDVNTAIHKLRQPDDHR